MQTDFPEQGGGIGVAGRAGYALNGVVFWVLGGGVGVERKVGDTAAALA